MSSFYSFLTGFPKQELGDLVGEQVGIWVNSLVTNDYPMATIFKLMTNSVAHQKCSLLI